VSGDLAALAYLDLRLFVNRVRALTRDPKRLLPWLLFLGWMAWVLPARFLLARGRARGVAFDWPALAPVLVPGLALAVLGLLVWLRTSRAPAAFSSAADARFLCGSGLSPRLVVFWLQLRQVRRQIAVWGANVIFWVFILPFALDVTLLDALRAAIALALAGTALVGLQLPVHVASQRGYAALLRAAGLALALLGLAALGLGVLALAGVAPVQAGFLAGLPPGSWLVGAAEGQPLAFIALLLAAAAAVAASAAVGADCYPELWQASVRVLAVRRAFRQGRLRGRWESRRVLQEAGVSTQGRRRETAISAGTRWVPPGAWTLLWKEWIALGRGALGARLAMALLVISFVVGAGIFLVASTGRRGAATSAGVASLTVAIGLAIAMSNAVRLASDLRSPLWWLSAASLRSRLAAWTLAGALKAAAPFAAAGAGAAVAARSPLWLGLAPVALAICWMLRATALAVYSLLPSGLDLVGPGRMLRGLAFYLLVLPLIVAVIVTGFVTRSFWLAGTVAALIAALEGAGLVWLAAWRIRGNGLAFALAERR
jgi:hypothetical protein